MNDPALGSHATDPPPPVEPPPEPVPWTFPDSLFVLVIWIFILAGLGGTLIYPLLLRLTDPVMASAIQLPVSAAVLVGVTMAYVAARYPGWVRSLFGPRGVSAADIGWGVLAGVVALLVFAGALGQLLEWLAQAIRQELPTVQEEFRRIAGDPRAAPILAFGAVVTAPIAEELLFRGMMFSALRKRLPLWPAAGISSLLFALNHFEPSLEGYLLMLLVITPLGMFLAWIYERRGTLVVPILAHALFNLPQVLQLIAEASQA